MFETAYTLGLTQFARSLSTPERIQRRTGRNAALEGLRLRNTGLDALFYDIKRLTPEEVFYVSDAIAAEGLIMIVPPTGGPMLTICESIDEYVLRGGADVHVMAIAGIGGSALGAAAFARNVADAVGEPVAAVVSGYGLGDIVNEAIGGAFLFGWLGNFRNECQVIDDVAGRPHFGAYSDRHARTSTPNRSCLDVDTVQALLADVRLSFHLLTGHSKGNLVLSEALFALRNQYPEHLKALGQRARVVTFGARITMPPEVPDVIDIIGDLDWYGEMNSHREIESDIRVPFAGHSTNTDLVGSLSVTSILKEMAARQMPVAASEEPVPAAVAPIPLTVVPMAEVEPFAGQKADTRIDPVPEPATIASGIVDESAPDTPPEEATTAEPEPAAISVATEEAPPPTEPESAARRPSPAKAAKRPPAKRSRTTARK